MPSFVLVYMFQGYEFNISSLIVSDLYFFFFYSATVLGLSVCECRKKKEEEEEKSLCMNSILIQLLGDLKGGLQGFSPEMNLLHLNKTQLKSRR